MIEVASLGAARAARGATDRRARHPSARHGRTRDEPGFGAHVDPLRMRREQALTRGNTSLFEAPGPPAAEPARRPFLSLGLQH